MMYHVSRRTDIPGCYWEWFLRRLDAGYALVRNPYYPEKISKFILTPDVCDGFSFLSKNYGPALRGVEGFMSLEQIVDTYRITKFDFTLTPYIGLEPALPKIEERISDLTKLCSIVGSKRISWLLAPVLTTDDKYDVNYHTTFIRLAVPRMAPLVSSCMVSEVNLYKHVVARAPYLRRFTASEREEVFGVLGEVAKENGLLLRCCPGSLGDKARFGFVETVCTSREALSEMNDCQIVRGNREKCGCVKMCDLGAYAPCAHNCAYCYAQPGIAFGYDPTSEMLFDKPVGDELMQCAKQVSLCKPTV